MAEAVSEVLEAAALVVEAPAEAGEETLTTFTNLYYAVPLFLYDIYLFVLAKHTTGAYSKAATAIEYGHRQSIRKHDRFQTKSL